ncbi:hypothetical protein H0H87_003202 [Tephrocybe sp. NHM501043]|nr:hypothetical protein H0H87_003202 [Tephrocybe sp. NHM501043]
MNGPFDTIVRGTVITCNFVLPAGISAFVSGLYGISRRSPQYALLAVAAGVNSGVTAFSFFALRELAISPILIRTLSWSQYARRRQELGISHPHDPPLEAATYSDLRKHNTLDSGLSGALAGGALRGWKSGPRAILPGALTISAACTLLQILYNEASISRLRYISGLKNKSPAVEAPAAPPIKPTLERFLSFIGVRQVTDQQYIDKMKATRDMHLKRIAELEQQIAVENAKEKSQDS